MLFKLNYLLSFLGLVLVTLSCTPEELPISEIANKTSTNCQTDTLGTITNGRSVTAYQSNQISIGQSCVSEVRICTDGILSGSYPYSSCSVQAATGIFMTEDFETGNLTKTNAENFKWSGTNRSGVIAATPRAGGAGSYSLNFRYPAGSFWSEQRFDMGTARKELWVRFWIQVPTNFHHNTASPSNNKLAALWMDDYSSHGDGPSVIWEFWSNGSGGSNLAVHYSTGGFTGAGPHLQHFPFISYPSDQGRWMQLVFHVKAASGRGSKNGIIRTYRRWLGDANFVREQNLTDADIASPPSGPDGWKAGYFMGWSNPSYLQETNWQMDDLEFSTTSLIE